MTTGSVYRIWPAQQLRLKMVIEARAVARFAISVVWFDAPDYWDENTRADLQRLTAMAKLPRARWPMQTRPIVGDRTLQKSAVLRKLWQSNQAHGQRPIDPGYPVKLS